jgi:hypothetical protein
MVLTLHIHNYSPARSMCYTPNLEATSTRTDIEYQDCGLHVPFLQDARQESVLTRTPERPPTRMRGEIPEAETSPDTRFDWMCYEDFPSLASRGCRIQRYI